MHKGVLLLKNNGDKKLAILIKSFSYIISIVPHSLLEQVCVFLGWLLLRIPNSRRRVLLSNLSHAFPEWDKQKLFASAQESASRMFEMGFFSLISPFMDIEQRKRTVFYDDPTLNLLRDLNDQNKPILFLVPHVCLFETLAVSPFFKPNKSKKLGAIYRPNRNLSLDKWIRDSRLKAGIKVFIGHDPSNINGIDALVYSSAIPKENPEIIRARQKEFQL